MNQSEVMAALESSDAMKHGHFKLSSGLHSDLYVQCAVALQWPGIAERLGHELGSRLEATSPTVVLGPAMGGLIIAHEVARFLGLRMVFCERVDGRMVLRRSFGFAAGDRVIVAEDVVTTGKSQTEAIELARSLGADPVGVGSIVDRSDGASFGVRFEALCRLTSQHWAPDDCPLCRAGEPLSSPGSRHLGKVS